MSSEVSRASHTQYAPHMGLPHNEPVTRARNVNEAPIGALAVATISAELDAPHQRDRTCAGHHHVDEQRHPCARNVHEDDPVALALLVVRRRGDEAAIESAEHRAEACPADPTAPCVRTAGRSAAATRSGEETPTWDMAPTQLTLILSADAAASGARLNDSAASAPST